jgi:hypothetical protein
VDGVGGEVGAAVEKKKPPVGGFPELLPAVDLAALAGAADPAADHLVGVVSDVEIVERPALGVLLLFRRSLALAHLRSFLPFEPLR